MSTVREGQLLLGKGKGRAESPEESESTPLLASQSGTSQQQLQTTVNARRRLWSKLTFVFLVSLCLSVVVFLLLALLGYSYAERALSLTPEEFVDQGLVLRGPDRVDVLNVTADGGIWLEVEGRVGFDAGVVVGVNNDDRDSTWRAAWKSIGRWGLGRVGKVSTNLSTIQVSFENNSLATVEVEPLEISLTTNPPSDESWLTAISTPVFITPTQNSTIIIQFIRDCWREGLIRAEVSLRKAVVRGGGLGDRSWRGTFNVERSNIEMPIQMKIPPLPGLPTPGRNTPFPPLSQLITLKSFSVSSGSKTLLLNAQATIIDPAPLSFNFTSPNMPFLISIPSEDSPLLPVASVQTRPFSLTHPNITVVISGKVIRPPSSSFSVLSRFIGRYLSTEPNPIVISTPVFPGIHVDALFPSPNPKPKVLRNVTIRNMHIRTTATGTFLASGTVYARAVLPKGMDIGLEVNKVLPDVLVFDGEVPEDVHLPIEGHHNDSSPPPLPPPLPDPLPEKAFGRLRPDDWLLSYSTPDQSEPGEGSAYEVTADIVDIPLQVLPGRRTEFSNFLAKVVFGSEGAVAGILGSAAVIVGVHGLPTDDGVNSELELVGLPLKGSVKVGKKSLFVDDILRWTEEVRLGNV